MWRNGLEANYTKEITRSCIDYHDSWSGNQFSAIKFQLCHENDKKQNFKKSTTTSDIFWPS